VHRAHKSGPTDGTPPAARAEDRLIFRSRHTRIAVLAAALVLVLATAAYAAFGAPETVQPGHRLNEYDINGRVLVADSAGRAMVLAVDDPGEHLLVLDRCGTGWTPTPVSPKSSDIYPIGLAVTPGGTAMAMWRAHVGGDDNIYSSVRAPGGAWGTPELVAADNTFARFGLSDAGDAVAAYSAAGATWTRTRPAGGTWQPAEKADADGGFFDLAVARNGDALIGTFSINQVQAYYRPAGGSWSGPEKVMDPGVQQDGTLNGPYMDVEFTGTGTAVMLDRINVAGFITMWGATRGAGWSTHILDNDNVNLGGAKLVRHPNGVVAMWGHAPNISNVDIGVARFGGAWETKKVYDMPAYFVDYDAAVNSNGEILFAAQLDHGTGAGLEDIYGAVVPSLSAPWPDLTLLSPASNGTTRLQREPHAAAGGADFFLGWSIHGGPGSSELIATNAVPACATAPPSPTPSATPSPTPQPKPTPTVSSNPVLADFVQIPRRKRCASSIKLKLKGPRDFPVKKVVVKLNGKRKATLTGRKLTKPLTLGHLPKRAFTVSFEISLKNGRTVKGKQRFPACR
jgi:hypothetical protein